MKSNPFAATAQLAFLFLLAQGLEARSAEVKFLGGGGFRTVMAELAPQFEKATGHTVVATWDSAGGMQRRVNAGEAFDVLFAPPELVDELIKQGKVVAGTRTDVGRGGLGVAVPKGAVKPNVSTVDAFKQALLNAKAIAYSPEGASGAHFMGLLDRLKIADQIKPKLKPRVARVADQADLVVTVITALLADSSVEFVAPLPVDIQSYLVLATGLSTAAPQPDAGKALIAFLLSDTATKGDPRQWVVAAVSQRCGIV